MPSAARFFRSRPRRAAPVPVLPLSPEDEAPDLEGEEEVGDVVRGLRALGWQVEVRDPAAPHRYVATLGTRRIVAVESGVLRRLLAAERAK